MQYKNGISSILNWLFTFLFVSAVIMGIRYVCVQSYLISTHAMESALYPGDYVLVNKLPVKGNPGRNRIILFQSPLRKDTPDIPILVSRCIGMPGDTIEVSREGYRINQTQIPLSPYALLVYTIDRELALEVETILKKLGIPSRNRVIADQEIEWTLTPFEVYQLQEELPAEKNSRIQMKEFPAYQLVIPKKGYTYRLDSQTLPAAREAILAETDGQAVIREHTLFIDGRETSFFHFSQDYYWVLSDNPEEAVDSRYLGFIPADHIIGNVWFCWLSKDRERIFKLIQ
ncbi:MAG: signal peptidase I [Tannerellaceae bacterium]|nr:signal peptidase I [Tannerellaceae bacterium]